MQLKIDEVFAEKIIPADDSVRLLDEMMEEMDHTALFRAYKRTGRPPATNPVTMMKILVYASMESNYTSRAIASSCNRDVVVVNKKSPKIAEKIPHLENGLRKLWAEKIPHLWRRFSPPIESFLNNMSGRFNLT